MNKLFVAALISAFSFAASAQTVNGSDTVTITSPGPVISLPSQPRIMSQLEFSKFVGTYELSNGQTLSLFVRGNAKYAALKGEASHELVAKSGNSFVAKDRQLAVTIDLHDMAEPGGEVLMREPGSALASDDKGGHIVRLSFH